MKKILLASTVALSLAFAPTQAQATPIGALIAGGLGLGTVGSTILGAAISIGANWLIQKLFAEEPKPQGIKQRMDSGGDNPISFIVGKYATPGKLVYVNTYGEDAKGLIMVVNLSEVPVDSLSSKIGINGRVCDIDFDDLDSDGFAKVLQYQKNDRNYCSVKFFNNPSSAPNFLTSTFGSDPLKPWTNDMIGKGCSYVVVYCRFSPDGGVWSGIPTFKFTVKGIPLYDIRKDSTAGGSGAHRWNDKSTHEYSDNCSVISYNILRGVRRNGVSIYGGNASAEQLPYDIWAAAMNTCDETVPKKTGGTVKRFTMGAEISVNVPTLDTLREIDNSCSGWTNEFGGTWKMFVGSPGASVVSITDDDILTSMEQTDDLFKPLQDTFNVAQASYPEPEACWEMKDAPTRYFDDFIEEDGGEELSLNMEFPFVSERNQVQRLMKAAVKESRRQRVHTIVLPPAFALLECFDVFTWNSSRNGYTGKQFLIIQKEDLLNCCQQITCREIDPYDYDWNAVADEFDSYDPTTDTLDPVTPTKEFTVTADFIDRPGTGKDKPAIMVTWDWAEEDLNVRLIQWRIRRTGKTKIIGKGSIRDYQDGEELITHRALRFGDQYDIQFRILPRRKQTRSEWTDWQAITMLSIDVPGNFTATAVSELGDDGKLDFFVKLSWDDVPQTNNGYGIVYTIGGEEYHKRTDGNKYRFAVKAPNTVTVKVRTRASDGGSPGAYTAPIVVNVTKKSVAPTTPTQLTVVPKHRRVVIKTEDHPDKDFKRWNVYFSKTNNFATGTKSRHGRSNRFVVDDLDIGDTYYFWLTAEDMSGNESAKFPASNTGGIAATISKLDDDDTEDSVLAAPTGLTLTKVQDTDEDGTIRTFIEMDCTPPAWATPKTYYAYSILVGAKEYRRRSDDTLFRFEVLKTGVLHTVKVRGIKGHGNRGSWSGTSTITPGKKTGLPTTASGLVALSKPLGIRIKWSKCTDKDYKETIIYRNTVNTFGTAVEIDRTKSSWYKDDDALVDGTTYYYWVAHVDNSDNIGTNSSSANATWNKIDDGDTDSTALSAPTGLSVTKVQDVDDDGKVNTYLKFTCTPPAWATSKTEYAYRIAYGSEVITKRSDDPNYKYDIHKTSLFHTVEVRAIKGHGNKSAWSSAVGITPTKKGTGGVPAVGSITLTSKKSRIKVDWPDIDDDTYKDYKKTFIYRNTSGTTPTIGSTSVYKKTSAGYFIDENVNTGTTYYYWVVHRDQSGNFSGLAGPAFATSGGNEVATFADLSGYISAGQIQSSTIASYHVGTGEIQNTNLGTGAVTTGKVDSNQITNATMIHNTGSISLTAGVETTIASATIDISNNSDVSVGMHFANVGGAAYGYTVRIYVGASKIYEVGVTKQSGDWFYVETIWSGISGVTTFDLKVVTPTTTHSVANRAVKVFVRKR